MDTFEVLFERLYKIYHMSDFNNALAEIQKEQSKVFSAYSNSIISYEEYDALFSLMYLFYIRIKDRCKEE